SGAGHDTRSGYRIRLSCRHACKRIITLASAWVPFSDQKHYAKEFSWRALQAKLRSSPAEAAVSAGQPRSGLQKRGRRAGSRKSMFRAARLPPKLLAYGPKIPEGTRISSTVIFAIRRWSRRPLRKLSTGLADLPFCTTMLAVRRFRMAL